MNVAEELLAGNRKALARLITLIENEAPEAREFLQRLYPYTGRAYVVGITGSPGTGKSTLVNQLAKEYRRQGKTVGIIAVDPTSPFSGGALLGDRVRMQELSTDPGIFIRSMATRGALGGLARTTREVIHALDAFGKEIVIVETVGVGQDEVDIVEAANTTLVVSVPGMGDDIQAIKAGVLEIADVLVVNKADKEGAERVVAELEMMLSLSPPQKWRPPLVRTVATLAQGVPELVAAIDEHHCHLDSTGERLAEDERRSHYYILSLALDVLKRDLSRVTGGGVQIESLAKEVATRQIDPYTAADRLLACFFQSR